MTIGAAKRRLQQGTPRCAEVVRILESLGFTVKDRKKAGHKVFNHDGLENFFGSNFDCGHGRNPEVKKAYLKKILKVIDEYEDDLKVLLGEGDNV